jgi:hypothetical protein
MAEALIENPILNSPFLERRRHFKFTDDGITHEKKKKEGFRSVIRYRHAKNSEGSTWGL